MSPRTETNCSAWATVLPKRKSLLWGVAVLVFAFTPLACGGDDVSDEGGSADSASPSDEGGTTTEQPSDNDSTDTDSADNGDSTDDGDNSTASDEEITSEDICSAVSIDVLAEASGLEITGSEPSEGSTPQCAYSYTSTNGPDSSFSVAAVRYTDSDFQGIEDGFNSAIAANEMTAGETVTTTEVDAGDEAVLISSDILTVGMVRTGNASASIIFPPDIVAPDQYEAMLVAVADALG